jgi:hypothetical protein
VNNGRIAVCRRCLGADYERLGDRNCLLRASLSPRDGDVDRFSVVGRSADADARVRRIGLEIVDVSRLVADAAKPRADGGPEVQVIFGFLGDVDASVDRDVGDR